MKVKPIRRNQATTREARHQVFVSSMLVLIGGLLFGMSHLPLPVWWLAWVALVPMLLLWDRVDDLRTKTLIQFTAEIYTAFLIAYAVAFFWPLLHTFSTFHALGKTTLLSFGSLLLVPAVFTLPFLVSLPFLLKRGRAFGLMVLVLFYLASELVFSYFAFPWPMLGHTQGSVVTLIQFVEFTGVTGLSLFVLVLNSLFFACFVAKRRKLRIRPALAFVVVIALCFGFGKWRRAQVTQMTQYVTVGLVQPAMDARTWIERLGASRISHLMSLSDSLITSMNAPPTFMIWPEMAIPAPPSTSRQHFVDDQLQAWIEKQEVALLAGALVPESTQPGSSRFYNRALLYRPYAERQHYNQVHLLPYGPQVPLAEQSPWLPPRDTRFVRGKSQQPLLFDDIRIGVLLGFEVLLGDYARQYPLKNVDFLVALTLDGWWGNTPGYRQHLSYLRLRSIETRRSIVHVAASGSTALLAPDGSVIYRADAHQPIARLAAVPVYDGITLYARYGNWLGYAALVLSLALTGWAFILLSWRYWQALDDAPEQVEALPGRF